LGETVSLRRSIRNAASPASLHDSANWPNPNTQPRSPRTRTANALGFATWLPSNAGLFIGIVCFMALCRGVVADRQLHSSPKLAIRSGLLVDLSGRPEPAVFKHMERRGNKDPSQSSTSTDEIIQASTATLLGSTATGSAATAAATASPTALPQVFDSNIANNFTSTTCPTFFQNLISDTAFQECYPLSLLLTVSLSLSAN